MTVVYLDSVFLFNALLDYLLVLSAARLAGLTLRRGRYILCGLLGGAYAAAVFLPGGAFLTAAPVKAAAGVLLALAAFGGERHFWRLTLLTFAIACALAGSVLALGLLAGQNIPNARGVFYTNVDSRTLLVSAAGVYLVLTVLFRAAASHGLRGERLAVTVMLLGKTASFTALRDTGSGLPGQHRHPDSDSGAALPSPASKRAGEAPGSRGAAAAAAAGTGALPAASAGADSGGRGPAAHRAVRLGGH